MLFNRKAVGGLVICKTCERLLDVYQATVERYGAAARHLSGLLGDDFKRAYGELEALRQASTDANEAMMEHWRKEHATPAGPDAIVHG
jgi:hypothetical protein